MFFPQILQEYYPFFPPWILQNNIVEVLIQFQPHTDFDVAFTHSFFTELFTYNRKFIHHFFSAF